MRYLLLLLVFLLSSFRLAAQATEGSILGTVTDSSGAAVPQATVRVTSVETGAERVFETSSTGEYVVTNLSVGSYAVAIEAKGFQRAIHPPVSITVKARIRVDAILQVGEVTRVRPIDLLIIGITPARKIVT